MKHIAIDNVIHKQMKLYAVQESITMRELIMRLWINYVRLKTKEIINKKGDESKHEIVKNQLQRTDF